MNETNYNPFLSRNDPPPPGGPPLNANPPIVQPQLDEDPYVEGEGDEELEETPQVSSALPFEYALDANDRFSKWFWAFLPPAAVSGILFFVGLQLLIAPHAPPIVNLLIAGVLAALYGAAHATWRTGKICRAIRIDEKAITLHFGSRSKVVDPLTVDAIMALSGIDLNGEGKGFANLRKLVLLTGTTVEKFAFEPMSNQRAFAALREACIHAWAVPSEGNLMPPIEIAEHHSDRAGIDSLRRLRKYYSQFVMQLAFSSLTLIVLVLIGAALIITQVGVQRMRVGGIRLIIFAGGVFLASLSSLRRLPRELAVRRKIRETEKSLAVALGIDFGK